MFIIGTSSAIRSMTERIFYLFTWHALNLEMSTLKFAFYRLTLAVLSFSTWDSFQTSSWLPLSRDTLFWQCSFYSITFRNKHSVPDLAQYIGFYSRELIVHFHFVSFFSSFTSACNWNMFLNDLWLAVSQIAYQYCQACYT